MTATIHVVGLYVNACACVCVHKCVHACMFNVYVWVCALGNE